MIKYKDIRLYSQTLSRVGLTDIQQDTIFFISQGLTNREIAERVGVKEKTIKDHIMKINRKLNTKNRMSIVKYVYDLIEKSRVDITLPLGDKSFL